MRITALVTFSTLSLVLQPYLALANDHYPDHVRRHHRDIARRSDEEAPVARELVAKRDDNARFTFYDVGLGACGDTNVASDFIVALDADEYGDSSPSPQCNKEITITANGKTTNAVIKDKCPGCPTGGLDMSRGLFDFFADESVGVLTGSWSYADGSGSSSSSAAVVVSTSVYVAPTTSSTWVAPTTSSSSTWVAPTTTSSSSSSIASSASSSSSSSSNASSSSLTSSSAVSSSAASAVVSASASLSLGTDTTGTVVDDGLAETEGETDSQNLNAANQVIIGLAGIVTAGTKL